MRQADGEYVAEQPQKLPAMISELTRQAAQNRQLTLKLNRKSTTSDPGYPKTQTKAFDHKIQHNKASACRLRKKKRINQNGDREKGALTQCLHVGKGRKKNFRACKQQATTAEKPLRASLQFILDVGVLDVLKLEENCRPYRSIEQRFFQFDPLKIKKKGADFKKTHCRINNGSAGLDEQPFIWPLYQQ